MTDILSIPIEFRLAILFVLGCFFGAAINRGIYGLAWYPRPISPWSRPHPDAPPRRSWDRLPVIGWLGLRREADLHGAGFWVRPAAGWLGLMLLAFIAALSINLARRHPVDCGCFGSHPGPPRSEPERLAALRWDILRDLGLLLLAAQILAATRKP